MAGTSREAELVSFLPPSTFRGVLAAQAAPPCPYAALRPRCVVAGHSHCEHHLNSHTPLFNPGYFSWPFNHKKPSLSFPIS